MIIVASLTVSIFVVLLVSILQDDSFINFIKINFLRVKKRALANSYKEKLNEQLDGTLNALGNTVSVTGNLIDAIREVANEEIEPMRSELNLIIKDVKLGRTIEESLMIFADRAGLPGLNAAVSAIIIGKKTGGDLSFIIGSIGKSLEEMKRLEGVIKTKTAEGRGQAIVMGIMPPLLLVMLNFINPTWLAPMWREPIGWLLLGVCVVLELTAMMLVKKIMAIDI